jgi:hypothetical protein
MYLKEEIEISNLKTPYYVSSDANHHSLDQKGVAQEESSWIHLPVTLKLTFSNMVLQREDNDYNSKTPIRFFAGCRAAYVFADSLPVFFLAGILRSASVSKRSRLSMSLILKSSSCQFRNFGGLA